MNTIIDVTTWTPLLWIIIIMWGLYAIFLSGDQLSKPAEGTYTMTRPMTEQTLPDNPGVAPVITDEKHAQALGLVVAYFQALGATEIKARLPGFEPPPVLTGTVEAHRPDFVCRQANSAKTPIIMEVVLDPKKLNASRATLFSSARQMWGSDLGFVVSSDYVDPEFRLRYRLNVLDIIPQKVLVI